MIFFAKREILVGESIVIYKNEQDKIVGIWQPDKYWLVDETEIEGGTKETKVVAKEGLFSFAPEVLRAKGWNIPSLTNIVLPFDPTQAEVVEDREDSRVLAQNALYLRRNKPIPKLTMKLPLNTPIILAAEHSTGGTMEIEVSGIELSEGSFTYVHFGYGDTYVQDDSHNRYIMTVFTGLSGSHKMS